MIFDLDGVLVSTDDCHYRAWKRMADEEGIYFDRAINQRLRGVSRMESLDIVLKLAKQPYTEEQKEVLAARKNGYYRALLETLSADDILPGTMPLLTVLKERSIRTAIGSSSKNTPLILRKIGLDQSFDAVADGNEITHSKPDPEVFLLAAKKLMVAPQDCVVVEDAEAGIDAAVTAGMKSIGVGFAAGYWKADVHAENLLVLSVDLLLEGHKEMQE